MQAKKKTASRKKPREKNDEMVQLPRRLASALCGVLASTLGLSAKDSVFIKGILTGKYRSLNQTTIDGLVLAAHKRCGGEVGSAVGYVFNDPKLIGYGRFGGGQTFVQIALTATE